MSALDALRSEARAALSETGFLRRDRTAAALFVTDYPLRVQNAEDALARLEAGGFTVIKERGLWRIDLNRERWNALIASLRPVAIINRGEETLPLYSIATRLQKVSVPPENQPLYPLRLTLICLDAGETERLSNLMAPLLAEYLRLKAPLPAAAGVLIARALNECRQSSEQSADSCDSFI